MPGNQTWKDSVVVEKSDRNGVVYRTLDWQEIVSEVAGPMQASDTRESWLSRAARRSRVSFRQIKALYYGQTKDPRTSVALGVLGAAEKARREASEQASRFESLAGAMNASDADFFSPEVLALIDAARRLRGLDRT
jgi:hypothetical protein